jgi:branched-chain amino acid transport system permease protein
MIKRDAIIGVVLLAVAILVPFIWPQRYILLELTLLCIWATVVTQWNLVFGVAGVFSLAQMAIFAMGGYVTGMFGLYLHWSLWAAMPMGAVAAVIFSIIIGLACLRLGGAYVALLTFAIAEAMYWLIITDTECFYMEGVTCRNFTGGTRGLVNFGDFGFRQLLGYKHAAFGNYFLALALLALATAFSIFVIRGPLGMAFAALRDNTTYARARGISRFKYQLLVFAASACFTGLAGAVYAGYFTVMGADTLNLSLLLLLLSMMVIGGLGTVWGPVVGAATLTLVNEVLNEFVDWRLLGLGVILILFTIFWPSGIVGLIEALWSRVQPSQRLPMRISGKPAAAESPAVSAGKERLNADVT